MENLRDIYFRKQTCTRTKILFPSFLNKTQKRKINELFFFFSFLRIKFTSVKCCATHVNFKNQLTSVKKVELNFFFLKSFTNISRKLHLTCDKFLFHLKTNDKTYLTFHLLFSPSKGTTKTKWQWSTGVCTHMFFTYDKFPSAYISWTQSWVKINFFWPLSSSAENLKGLVTQTHA